MHRRRDRILALAKWGGRSLVRLYPRSFRERYGQEITDAFSAHARERLETAGLSALLWLEVRTLGDTVVAASREHYDGLSERFRERRRPPASAPWTLWRDMRYALRFLLRRPGFSLAVVLTLALGLGANTAIFSVIYAALLRPLPFEDSGRVVTLRHVFDDRESDAFSLAELEALRRRSATLEGVEELHSMSFFLLGEATAERVVTGVVSTGFFDLLGVEPLLGRRFRAGDVHEPVLLLSHDYWLDRFDGDSRALGRTVRMNDRDHTIVGVLPPLPPFPGDHEVFMPSMSCPFRRRHLKVGDPMNRVTTLTARLAPQTTIRQAEAEVEQILRDQALLGPDSGCESRGVRIVSAAQDLAQSARATSKVLLAAVAFVLLAAYANAANLTLARRMHREQEFAVRSALGGGRRSLVRQLTVEGLVMAVLGGLVGLAVAAEMLQRLMPFAARFSLRADEIRIDGAVYAFLLVMVLAIGVLLGLLPAIPGWRHAAQALQLGSWGLVFSRRRQRLQRLLVIVQVAVSFVLLAGAGLMVRTVLKLHQVEPGFRSDNVLTMTVDLNWSHYEGEEAFRGFFTHLLDELALRSDIASAAVARTFPLHETTPASGRLWIEGRPFETERPEAFVDLREVSEGYFETLGIELLDGRGFACGDDGDALPVAIVNQSLARRFFSGDSAVGQRISIDEGDTWSTVIGLVADVKQHGLAAQVRDEVYTPLRQHGSRQMMILVRTQGDHEHAARQMLETVSEIESEQAIANLRTLEQIRQGDLALPRWNAALLGLFAAFAMVLSATGVYGMLTFFVSQRTHEIGLRIALGAGRRAILKMVLGEGVGLTLVGMALGLTGALLLSRSMTNLLFDVEPVDPWTFAATALVLLGVTVAACWIPARWASAIQPIEALRRT